MSDLISPKTWLAMLPSEMNEWLNYMVKEYKKYFTLQLLDLFSEYEELQTIIKWKDWVNELIKSLQAPEFVNLDCYDANIPDVDNRQISVSSLITYIKEKDKTFNFSLEKLDIINNQMEYDEKVKKYKELHYTILQAQLQLEKFNDIDIK